MTSKQVTDIVSESLRDWFKKEKWVRISSSGNIAGPCGTSKNKKNPDRCLPKAKAQSLTKGQRAATAAKKKKAGAKGKTVVKNTKKATVKKEGLWANINAKKKAGRKPSHGNSNAHKQAEKAGKALGKESANPQDGKAAPYGSGYKKLKENQMSQVDFNTIGNVLRDSSKAKQIHALLVQMFPQQKELLNYNYKNDSYAEFKRFIFHIDKYKLEGPVSINHTDLKLDPQVMKDREKKYQEYIDGKIDKYFRDSNSDPRTLDLSKMPPITVDSVGEVMDGNHRAFLAIKQQKPLKGYKIVDATNTHPNVKKILQIIGKKQKSENVAPNHKGKHQGTNYKWPMSQATKDRKEADKKVTKEDIRNLVVGMIYEVKSKLVTLGYDLEAIQDVVDHLRSNYKEGQDYELHIGRGDDLPNAITFPRGEFRDDHDLNDMLNAAQSDEDRYDAYSDDDLNEKKDDRCTRLAKQKYDTWPSAYASGAVVRCRRGEIWKKK